ncbi:DUF924 family protein [soil metagenome]
MDPRIDDVLAFWFGASDPPGDAIMARWFTKDPAFDDEIRRRFGALQTEAASLPWRGTARGELALLILLDQFPRNLFRGDPRSFATDPLALEIAHALRDSKRWKELTLHQRMFVTLPFQHAEDHAMQVESVADTASLRAEATDPSTRAFLDRCLSYAHQHQTIIERFGRFPHRNEVLGRVSTDEERAFLSQPGSSF